ncbi:MAG: alpha-L-rhamnosidase N-terminal domain-containing protein, partial [Bacillales bacterium]|nr:alpha-L-rhamnosidase N-terminal domain-containing protein [Bacillales bacterium]
MIKEIRVENQLEPINIIEENPRFSWVLSDVKRQISYQVIVSSSLNNEGDLYNSGEVISNKNFDIYYRGSPLKSLQVCYLKVIVKTDKGIDVAYSKFEIALKEEKDFKAQWIFLPVNHSGGTQYFRKQLEMPVGNIKRARVFLVGLGYSELYINGQKVNENCYLNPGQTSYNETVLYDCYDILKYLKEEKNVLGVEVGYGWYGARKIRAYLYIEYEDGTIYEDGTRAGYGWWVAKTPTIYNSVYGGE